MSLLEASRVTYAVLAFLCALGFGMTLALRWDVLARGERILRVGLIFEHMVLTYGGYVALAHHYPGGITASLLVGALSVMLLGFVDFILADLLPAYRHGDSTPTPNPRPEEIRP